MIREFRDPIHNMIKLDGSDTIEALLLNLIDSKEVQRLRYIKQLGVSWLAYHCAEHSRFGHSLGAMWVAKQMFDKLVAEAVSLKQYHAAFLAAALLHDVGHGPFSHTSEPITGVSHEEWTYKIILDEGTEINNILKRHDQNLPTEVVSMLKGELHEGLGSLVSGELDCDRCDYLLRDNYHSGTDYARFDLDIMLDGLRYDEISKKVYVDGARSIHQVERYLYGGYSSYINICYHKKSLAGNIHLRKILRRAKKLLMNGDPIYIDNRVSKWLVESPHLTVNEYLYLDDPLCLSHLKDWSTQITCDSILRDLSDRFMTRRIFRAKEVDLNTVEAIGKEAFSLIEEFDLDPEYYMENFQMEKKPSRFYNPTTARHPIHVKSSDGDLVEISKISPIIKSLASERETSRWIVTV